jgi:Spy/CpxP family protein refolding chaperone
MAWRNDMTNFLRAVVVLACAWCSQTAAAAQTDEPLRGRVHALVQEAAFNGLVEKAGFDPKTAHRVQDVWQKYDAQIQPILSTNRGIRVDLRQRVAAVPPDDAKLVALSDQLIANHQRVQTLRADQQREVRQLLTPAQFAKLQLTWPEIQGSINRQIRLAAHGSGEAAGGSTK